MTVTVETDPTTGSNFGSSDGIDRLFNIEKLRFADGEVNFDPRFEAVLHAYDAAGNFADKLQPSRLQPERWQPSVGLQLGRDG